MSEKINKLMKIFQELNDLGLWPRSISPPDPQALERIYNLDVDLYNRKYKLSVPDDRDIEEIREEYSKESKKIRERKRVKRAQKERRKRQEWKKLKETQFTYLGKGVSAKLSSTDENTELIKKLELPSIENADKLCEFLEIEFDQLVWMVYHRKNNRFSNYIDFEIPKKSGGVRKISAPKPYLKRVQYIIKEKILDKIVLPDHVMGFKNKTSIFDNAREHLNAEILINVDIENFFQSIRYFRVRSMFIRFGYSGEIATVLSLLCTKQYQKTVKIGEIIHYVFSESRYLPQGAPTSPVISNIIALPMDRNIKERVEKLGYRYTRYADDISISTIKRDKKIKAVMSIVHRTMTMHGFSINNNKTKIRGKHERQEVTGLVINSGEVRIPRWWRRILRARINRFISTNEGDPLSLLASIAYLDTTHPELANKYLQQIIDKTS